jgi:hypothetical protein
MPLLEKKLPNVNNRPIGENSPNLVTLISITISVLGESTVDLIDDLGSLEQPRAGVLQFHDSLFLRHDQVPMLTFPPKNWQKIGHFDSNNAFS